MTDHPSEDWPRPIVKAAEGIWLRLHQTDRRPRRFDQLDVDTFDDLCIQAELAVNAYLAASPSVPATTDRRHEHG